MLPRPLAHRTGSRVAAILAAASGLLCAIPAGAPILPKAVIKSFFVAGPGSTSSQPFASDTEIQLTYTAGLAGQSGGTRATTDLYLYDASGEPMTSGTGQVVCAPCAFETGLGGSTPRRLSISVDDLIVARGGFGASTLPRQGFVVLDNDVDGGHLAAEVRIKTTVGTAGQPITTNIAPSDVLRGSSETPQEPRVFVLSRLHGIDDWGSGDWAIFGGTYLGGIGGIAAGAGATLELYLFEEDGTPSGGQGTPVCAPCTYPLGNGGATGTPRHVEIRIPAAPTQQGAGFALFRVIGADPSAVVLEHTDIDSIPGTPPTLVVRNSRLMTPLPQSIEGAAVGDPDVSGAALALSGSPNPAAGDMTFAFDLARPTAIDLEVFDAAGRRVATVASGTRAAGRHELRWNRRDASGKSLSAGVYFGRLRAGDGSRITRLVFLPK